MGDEDRSRFGHTLQTRGQIDRQPGDGILALHAATSQHPAGGDANPHPEAGQVALGLQFDGDIGRCCQNVQRGANGAVGIVLTRRGQAENGLVAVALEAHDAAASGGRSVLPIVEATDRRSP